MWTSRGVASCVDLGQVSSARDPLNCPGAQGYSRVDTGTGNNTHVNEISQEWISCV